MSGLSEFEKLFVKPKEGRTLIVGSKLYGGKEDRRKRYRDAVGVDMLEGDGVDVVCNLEDATETMLTIDGHFEHVECMSVLEHSQRPWEIAKTLQYMMKEGSTIFVSVPWLWRVHSYPDDLWRLSVSAIKEIFPSIEWMHTGYAATNHFTTKAKAASMKDASGAIYLERTETCGFGIKR